LVARRLLDRSAADLTAADHQPPLGMRRIAETLAHRVAPSCMRRPAEKKGRAPSDLDRTVAYRFTATRPGQAAGFGPAWLRSAAPADFFFFFSESISYFCKSLQV
jgi:hypothetical protein